jgi:hypothetical protein
VSVRLGGARRRRGGERGLSGSGPSGPTPDRVRGRAGSAVGLGPRSGWVRLAAPPDAAVSSSGDVRRDRP